MNTPAEILQIWIGNGVKKANLPVFKMILLGMAAGVYIGFGAHVFLLATAAAKDMAGKIFAIWFPIMMFGFAGFEHSVANMTYIPLGMFLGAEVSVGQLLIGNLLPVTIGNLIGGAVIVPVWYYFSFKQWDTHQTVDTPCSRIE